MTETIKRDFINYLISIIIPGLINFFSIPVIKKMIGSESYGEYSLWYSTFFILIAFFSGWFGVYIIRFKADFSNAQIHFRNCFLLLKRILLLLLIVSFIGAFIISDNIIFSIIYTLAIGACTVQNALNSVTQANFKSKIIVISETCRVVTFFLFYLLFLGLSISHFLEKLFASLFISYLVSIYILYTKNDIEIFSNRFEKHKFSARCAYLFGIPVMLSLLITTSLPFIDKALLANKFGLSIQGDYQAIFDLIYRSVTILFLPVSATILPHLSTAYANKNYNLIKEIITKAVIYQITILIICLGAYLLGAWRVLFSLLSIENGEKYYYVSLLILVTSFIVQIGIIVQKPFEIMKSTSLLLYYNFISFIVAISVLLFVYAKGLAVIYYPVGLLVGYLFYISLCIFKTFQSYKRAIY